MIAYYILFASVLISTAVGAVATASNFSDIRNKLYGLLTLSFIVLSIANTLSISSGSNQLLMMQTVLASSSVSVYLIYCLIVAIRGLLAKHKKTIVIWGLLTFSVTLLVFSPFVFSGLEVSESGATSPIPAAGFLIYIAHFLTITYLSGYHLLLGMRSGRTHQTRSHLRALLFGLLPTLIFLPITVYVLPFFFGETKFIALTPLYATFFVVFVGYAIVRHGLFDVKQALVRSAAYALVLIVLAGIYYVLAYAMSLLIFGGNIDTGFSLSPLNVLLALTLAFIFQPVKNFFDRVTDRIFYRGTYKIDDLIAEANKVFMSTTDIHNLLHRTSELIVRNIKAKHVMITVYNNTTSRLLQTGTHGYRRIVMQDALTLSEYFNQTKRQYIYNLTLPEEDIVIKRLMTSYKLAIIAPIYGHDNVIAGFLCLGEYQKSAYSPRDIKTIRLVADGLVVAVQNALSVQAVKDLNETLQQRIYAATKELRLSNAQLRRLDEAKDEFVSMASHQLRTPLTSIKGYISMILEGDAGKVTDTQKTFLKEAFQSSERMVRLINDFLNVSRLQTGKFTIDKKPTDLVDLVEQEINSLRISAESRGLEFSFKAPKKVPLLNIDRDKISQVVMNFADNAIYYSKDGGEIKVRITADDSNVTVLVKDSGIGVPVDEQARLFTKFYRASNARTQRPDGTGVGIFLAKKVISDHGGEVIFESKENKGSTFGFTLPIKKLLVKDKAE